MCPVTQHVHFTERGGGEGLLDCQFFLKSPVIVWCQEKKRSSPELHFSYCPDTWSQLCEEERRPLKGRGGPPNEKFRGSIAFYEAQFRPPGRGGGGGRGGGEWRVHSGRVSWARISQTRIPWCPTTQPATVACRMEAQLEYAHT